MRYNVLHCMIGQSDIIQVLLGNIELSLYVGRHGFMIRSIEGEVVKM